MRSLVVAHTFPWPLHSGAQIRVSAVVETLAELGEVDLFCLIGRSQERPDDPPAGVVSRWAAARRPDSTYRGLQGRLAWWFTSELPLPLGDRDWSEVREAFVDFVGNDSHDLVWLQQSTTFAAVGDLVDADHVVVDLDDLDDRKLEAQREVLRERRDSGLARVRQAGADVVVDRNLHRWRELQRRAVEAADAVVVCSELDRGRLGAPTAAVVPNGYPDPDEPVGTTAVGDPPTVVLPGLLTYAPNADAARWLAEDVRPHLQDAVPGVQIRLVGSFDQRVADLDELDGVTLTGFVDEITDELARADVVAVPVRIGSGTRVKILEAFAHGIPVVSTSLGCEGLGASDGVQLRIADDAASFAAACATLLTDTEQRDALRASGRRHYEERFRRDAIALRLRDLVEDVTRPRSTAS